MAQPPATISVRGSGTTRGEPDKAILHLAVEAAGATAAEALGKAAADADRLIAALPSLGVAAGDVTTMGINAHPKHDPRGAGGLAGFVAGTTVVVAVTGP